MRILDDLETERNKHNHNKLIFKYRFFSVDFKLYFYINQ